MAKLKYPRLSYMPNRTDLSIKQVKAEYQRLRSVAQKRIQRLQETEFKRSESVQYYAGAFPGVRGKSEAQLRKMLYEAQAFTSDKGYTLRGMKKKKASQIKAINQMLGEDMVTDDNYFDFIEFISDKNVQDIAKGLDSDQVIELWRMKEKGMSDNAIVKDWAKLLENKEAVNGYLDEHPVKSRRHSSRDLRKILK